MADQIDIEIVPKITAAAMAALKGQLGGLLIGAGGILGQIGKLATAGGHPAGAVVEGVGKALIAVGEAVTLITRNVQDLVHTIADLARAASPAAYEQFQFALKDLYAVVGRLFVPLLQSITGIVRILADHFLALRPALQPVMDGLAQIVAELGKTAAAFATLIPV